MANGVFYTTIRTPMAFLPWLERTAFTRPAALAAPVDTIFPATVQLPTGKFWDDADASLFLDLTGDGLEDFVYFGDPARIILVPGAGKGTFGTPALYSQPHEPLMVIEARWQGLDPATLPARGFRSRLVAVRLDTSPSTGGLYITTTFDDGTPQANDILVGAKWSHTPAYGAVVAGAHFNTQHESLVIQRQPDPESPGDTGAIALVPGEISGTFLGYPSRIWPTPPAYIGQVFDVADVDGDGGVDLITVAGSGAGKAYHVFKAVPGGTWSTTPVTSPLPAKGIDVCSLRSSGDAPGLVDVTNDGRADLVCANGSGIFVRPGMPNGTFANEPIVTPFEINGRPWRNALLQDIDGDGHRDYVTIYEGALWYKLNRAGPANSNTSGVFGGLQRVPLGGAAGSDRSLNTLDAVRARTDAARSAVIVFESSPGKFALREMASNARQP